MWAKNGTLKRHFWGSVSGHPVALCGKQMGDALDYTHVTLAKCERCLELIPKYRKDPNDRTLSK